MLRPFSYSRCEASVAIGTAVSVAAVHRPTRPARTLTAVAEVVQHTTGNGLLLLTEGRIERLQHFRELFRLGRAFGHLRRLLGQALAALLDALGQRQLLTLLAILTLHLLLGETRLALGGALFARFAALLEAG